MKKKKEAKPVALVGLMGSGKTETARALARDLGASVADLDAMLEAVEGLSVAELFARSGEAWFRARESELLAQAVASGVRVIATGGGVVLDEARRRLLREACDTVWLEVSPAEAARRVAGSPGSRPLLAGGAPEERLSALLAERSALYAEVAAHRVFTDGRTPREVAALVREWLASRK
ncbi:MAG: shikimate kinase [Candidatus Eisenbacteria bacterium]|uniref:Shikimate kinase n=1 Tax=Eiseniibacteriota bacterium TaxID=2212470 RepID=A0A933SGI7_UNCEI|nr:shikimate kinase [Candidatus Eisenbacteria bacterium]